jgi:hypothetical protein
VSVCLETCGSTLSRTSERTPVQSFDSPGRLFCCLICRSYQTATLSLQELMRVSPRTSTTIPCSSKLLAMAVAVCIMSSSLSTVDAHAACKFLSAVTWHSSTGLGPPQLVTGWAQLGPTPQETAEPQQTPRASACQLASQVSKLWVLIC